MFLETNTVIAKNFNVFSVRTFKTVLVNLLLFLSKCYICKRIEKWKLDRDRSSIRVRGTVELTEQPPSSLFPQKRKKTTIPTLQKAGWAAEWFGIVQMDEYF
jgi:hypothetical protein